MSGTVLRDRLPGQLPGSRAQRRLSAIELLSAVPVVLAGRDQGGLSRSRQYHRPLRRPRAQPLFGDAIAERRLVERIRAGSAASGIHPVQRLSARPLYVPVLRRALSLARADLRPPRPAIARWAHDLDQRCHSVRDLQFVEGQPAAARERDVPAPPTGPADHLPAAAKRPRVPAQLSARELARLSLLGYRARPVLSRRTTGVGADGGTPNYRSLYHNFQLLRLIERLTFVSVFCSNRLKRTRMAGNCDPKFSPMGAPHRIPQMGPTGI